MKIDRLTLAGSAVIPLMAALPYRIDASACTPEGSSYDPTTQFTHFARRDFSTCRCDESVGGLFSSRSDTKKDD